MGVIKRKRVAAFPGCLAHPPLNLRLAGYDPFDGERGERQQVTSPLLHLDRMRRETTGYEPFQREARYSRLRALRARVRPTGEGDTCAPVPCSVGAGGGMGWDEGMSTVGSTVVSTLG